MPRRLTRLKPAARAKAGELDRGHELLPAVRSRLEPAQHIFGPDDGEREALERAVEGRSEKKAARLDERGGGGDESLRIGGMLDHLHRAHDVEASTASAASSSTVAAR